MRVVTSLCRKYLPGLKALNNSIRQNSPDCELWAILDGNKRLQKDVEALGVRTILNPDMGAPVYPVSSVWPEPVPSMYWRAMIPRLFPEDERTVYIDADAIVLRDLKPLFNRSFDEPIAATMDGYMRASMDGLPAEWQTRISFITSLMVFNHAAYDAAGVLDKCLEIMQRKDYGFKTAIQGVMQVALLSNWHQLPVTWQAHPGRQQPTPETLVLHFLGTKPWNKYDPLLLQKNKENKLRAREIWKEYA